MADFNKVQDSGERQNFDTGSVRDTNVGKGRFDLIPPYAMERIAKHFENGCEKYGDRNWELGQPLSRYLDSALRHINKILMGIEDEDHMAAACWNLMALIETQRRVGMGLLPEELDNLPTPYSGDTEPMTEPTTSEPSVKTTATEWLDQIESETWAFDMFKLMLIQTQGVFDENKKLKERVNNNGV